ncbi:MAG: OmpA family protein [Candidatus Omnitrophica bacterium]|nr:OmpA family protein [Candidatus Omnitrophota bacterium]
MKNTLKKLSVLAIIAIPLLYAANAFAEADLVDREEARMKETQEMQKKFDWWPTDAQPAPVEDKAKGGYWWWPKNPGPESPKVWGNRGYCYVRKYIFDYMEEELPPPQPQELRPSLLIRKIIKNVKVYFDYDKADIRSDAVPILDDAVRALSKNPNANILITGNCDIRGTEKYNEKLGKRRGEAVKRYMLDNGIAAGRIKIISRGKLDAIAYVTDLVGMQKDRNAQFMVAEVEEVMMPYTGRPPEDAKVIEEGKYVEEKEETVTGAVRVSTKEYIVKEGDSLWKIAERELGKGNRWEYLYEINKDVIKNPNKLKKGTKIVIPIE